MTERDGDGWDGLSWTLRSRRPMHDYRIFRTEERTMTHPGRDGDRPFYIIDAPDWVNVIALTRDDECVLIKQFRQGVDALTLEIPGGMVDPGEPPAVAAARELREETGFEATRWAPLGVVQANPAIQNNETTTWLALDAAPTAAQDPDENELIEVVRHPLRGIPDLIATGAIQHALVVAAFAHLVIAAGGFQRPPSDPR